MGQTEKDIGGFRLSRRDFLKASAAAAAAAGSNMEFMFTPELAAAYELDTADYTITTTTCPYCSASCGQRVAADVSGNAVIDIYGDFESPFNAGGLCAKGAGSLQLVNNPRRIGVGIQHEALGLSAAFDYDAAYDGSGVAYLRDGSGTEWTKVALPTALADIATRLKSARDEDPTSLGDNNSSKVAFFGSSHINNEPCYVYRKLIANFGTSNTEHQARI